MSHVCMCLYVCLRMYIKTELLTDNVLEWLKADCAEHELIHFIVLVGVCLCMFAESDVMYL